MSVWSQVAELYDKERDNKSLAAILIDKPLVRLVEFKAGPLEILDFGAGSGTLSRILAIRNHNVVAFEPNSEMRSVFTKHTPDEFASKVELVGELQQIPSDRKFDCVLCSNVFDHVDDVPELLRRFRNWLKDGGRMIVSIPHPFKSVGAWEKEETEVGYKYGAYRIEDYYSEKQLRRIREDSSGNVVVKDILQWHRTLATYFNWICEAGFTVERIEEPKADQDSRTISPVFFEQCSRYPYFLLLDCMAK